MSHVRSPGYSPVSDYYTPLSDYQPVSGEFLNFAEQLLVADPTVHYQKKTLLRYNFKVFFLRTFVCVLLECFYTGKQKYNFGIYIKTRC